MIREPLMDTIEAVIVQDMGLRRQPNDSKIPFMHWYALCDQEFGVEFWYADNDPVRVLDVGSRLSARLYWADRERLSLSRISIGATRTFWTNRSFVVDPGRAR